MDATEAETNDGLKGDGPGKHVGGHHGQFQIPSTIMGTSKPTADAIEDDANDCLKDGGNHKRRLHGRLQRRLTIAGSKKG